MLPEMFPKGRDELRTMEFRSLKEARIISHGM
jgi:hypothetical protein